MPLFNYMCTKCETIVEKFQHNSENKIEIKCEQCGQNLVRVVGQVRSKITYDAKGTYRNRIGPEVERINNNIAQGKDKDFLDIAGE